MFQSPEAGGVSTAAAAATGARDGSGSAGATAATGGRNSSSLDTLLQRQSLETISVGVGLPQKGHDGVVSGPEGLNIGRSSANIEQDGDFRREVVLFEPSASEQRAAEAVKAAARDRKMRRSRRAR